MTDEDVDSWVCHQINHGNYQEFRTGAIRGYLDYKIDGLWYRYFRGKYRLAAHQYPLERQHKQHNWLEEGF
jgi:hypothetical protein